MVCPGLRGETGTLGCLVEERYLRRVPREAFLIHIDAMPSIEIDRFVIAMADFAADVDFSVACHVAPHQAGSVWVRREKLFVCIERKARWILTADHDGYATAPHHLRADVGLASGATA